MENTRTLPEYLKCLRKAAHYKQEEIASYLQICRQTYSHYETGRIRPPATTLYHLAKFYGVSVDEILEHTEPGSLDAKNEEVSKGDIGQEIDSLAGQEFIACFHALNEQNRKETLSIMWEIMQAKINKQNSKK